MKKIIYKGQEMTPEEAIQKIQPKVLSEEQIKEVSRTYNLDYACIKAVIEVESAGSGFQDDGRPKILFEGHRFWNNLIAHDINPVHHIAGNEDILYPKWNKAYYKLDQWYRFEKAKKISPVAAIESASWGLFQIMGENVRNGLLRRYNNVNTFFVSQHLSEHEHLLDFVDFIQNKKIKDTPLIAYLRSKNWEQFSRFYNGPGYKKNRYDEKLENAYYKYKELS